MASPWDDVSHEGKIEWLREMTRRVNNMLDGMESAALPIYEPSVIVAQSYRNQMERELETGLELIRSWEFKEPWEETNDG